MVPKSHLTEYRNYTVLKQWELMHCGVVNLPEEDFIAHARSSPLFYEALASASTMSESLSIARDAGFDVDEVMVRSVLSKNRPDDEIDESELGDISGGGGTSPW